MNAAEAIFILILSVGPATGLNGHQMVTAEFVGERACLVALDRFAPANSNMRKSGVCVPKGEKSTGKAQS